MPKRAPDHRTTAAFWNHPPLPEHRALVERIRKTPLKRLTSDEVFEREVSFVYGNLPVRSPLSKNDVRRILREERGTP